MEILSQQRCIPCKGGIPPFTHEEIIKLLPSISGWNVKKDKKIWREFSFKNFVAAVDFVNRVADIAECEDHHPDILIHDYKKVRIELLTYAISGLTQNDFIMAAKINEIV